MRPAQTYKPSNTFSFGGFILMFISMLFAGAVMSFLYVILQDVIPIIYLCILITIGFGAAIGGIGALFVKLYKIRHPGLAIAATLIAMFFVYIFHWCIYVSRDYDKNVYDSLKGYSAAYMFAGADKNDEITEEYAHIIASARNMNLNEWQNDESLRKLGIKNGFDDVFGTTEEEIVASVLATKNRNAYDFLYNYRKLPKHTIGYLLVHPGELWNDITNINEVGRWSMRSTRYSSSYSSSSNESVSGVLLWLTWLGEMILMFAPAAAIVAARAGTPFIEQDNDWAITDKPQLSFKFVDPFPGNSNGETQFKNTFKNDIDSLFTLQPLLPQMGVLNTYYSANYCHSKFYTENYLTITHTRVTNASNNQRSVSSVVKKVKVDADYIATLHGMFHYNIPSNCPGTNKFAQQQEQEQPQQNTAQQNTAQQSYDQQYQQPQQDYNTQQSYDQQYQQPQQDYNTQQSYDQQYQQPQQDYNTQQSYDQQYQQPQQQSYQPQYQPMYQPQAQQDHTAQEDFSSGDMDGIDTSNIDLSSLDNMNH